MSEYNDLFDGEEEDEGITPIQPQSKPVTYVGFVWDHSGSMGGSRELARTNFNEQLVTLKKDSDKVDYIVTVIEFDDKIKEVVDTRPINEVQEMKNYWTGGWSALYDAVGQCIGKIEKEMNFNKSEDKAALIIVMTDGEENCSKEYNNDTIRSLIEKMDAKDDWSFVFMGAGIDKKQAMSMGFSEINTMTFDKSDEGYRMSDAVQNESLSTYSTMRSQGIKKASAFYSNSTVDKSPLVKDESKTVEDEG